MKAEFLKRQLLEWFAADYSEGNALLKSLTEIPFYNNISDSKKQSVISEKIIELEKVALSFQYPRYLFRGGIAESSDVHRYLGLGLLELVKNCNRDFGQGSTFVQAIKEIIENRQKVRQRLSGAYLAFQDFGVETLSFEKQPFLLEIVLPKNMIGSDFELVARSLVEQSRIIKLFNDSFSRTREDLPVFALSTSRISTFLEVGPKTASHLSAALMFCLVASNQYLDMQIKQAQLNEVLGKAAPVEIHKAVIEQISKKCAEEIVNSLSDKEKLSFELQKCEAAAADLVKSITNGYEYHLHIPEGTSSNMNNENGSMLPSEVDIESLRKIAEAIDLKFAALPTLEDHKRIEFTEGATK